MTQDIRAILGIDPGGTTGLAYMLPDGRFLTATAKTAEEVWAEIDPKRIKEVVYEQFGGQVISEHGLHTVRVIGGIQAMCFYHDIPVHGRTPQSRKAFIDKAQAYIKATKGASFVVHEVDALSHLISYCTLGILTPNRKTTAKSYTRSRA